MPPLAISRRELSDCPRERARACVRDHISYTKSLLNFVIGISPQFTTSASGVTRYVVFSHRPLESDDLFSCRLLSTPIFPRR